MSGGMNEAEAVGLSTAGSINLGLVEPNLVESTASQFHTSCLSSKNNDEISETSCTQKSKDSKTKRRQGRNKKRKRKEDELIEKKK